MSKKEAGILEGLEADLVGVVRLADFKDSPLEQAALRLLPDTKSVVVVAVALYPEVLEHLTIAKKIDGATVKELLDAHYIFLNNHLDRQIYRVGAAAHRAGFKAMPLPAAGFPYDARRVKSIISYKGAAQAAGLGIIGRSSLVVTPGYGPRVRLAGCLTSAELEPTASIANHNCGDCRVCVDKCPSGALSMPEAGETSRINRYACTAFRNGNYCEECMRNCPGGK